MTSTSDLSPRSSRKIPAERTILYLMLALAFVRGVIYAAVVPPWQAPDEPAQFERTRAALTAEEWANSAANELTWYSELRDSLVTFQFLDYTLLRVENPSSASLTAFFDFYQELYKGLYGSRLSYAVMGLPLFFIPHGNITLQLYLVRMNTVLIAVAIIFLAYQITRTLFPEGRFLILGVPLLILFNPQHTHIVSTVNNGNLAELLATGTLYFVVRGFMRGFSLLNITLALGLSLLAMWTKATAYFLLAPLGCIAVFHLWQYRRHWRWLPLIAVTLGGLIYLLAPSRLNVLARMAWDRLTQGKLFFNPLVISDIFDSFWAMPGWAIVRLHPIWYQILLYFCLLAGLGLAILLVKRWPSVRSIQFQPQLQTLLVLGISIGTAVAIQVGWHILTGTLLYRQGRSLYPVIVPIAIFLLLGWRQLIPSTWQKPGLLLLGVAFFLFDSLVLLAYIIPFFYSRY